jgi:hypothetical protein
MSAPFTPITTHGDYISATAASYAQVDWAMEALRAGEPERAMAYLEKAHAELKAAIPSLESNAHRYYARGLAA